MKRGVTLIELLVAMAIATLVGYIAFDLVRDEQGNYTKTRTKVRLQADARDAVRILEEDFANLGFRQGLRSGGTMPVGSDLRRICLSGTDTVLRPDQRLFVFDDGGNGSDTIEGRFFRVSPTEGVQCAISPIRVRYFVRGTQLIRQFWNAGDSVNLRSEAVVLEDVVTMQAQAATDTLLTNQLPSVRPKNILLENPTLTEVGTANLTPIKKIPYGSTGDSLAGWRGWGKNVRELQSGIGPKLMPDATYRLSCMIQVDSVFKNAFAIPTDTGFLQVYVQTPSAVWTDTLDIRLPPHSETPFWVSWEFQPYATGLEEIQFGLRSRIAVSNTSAQLHVGRIQVSRVSGDPVNALAAPQWFWRDAAKVNPVQDSMFRARTEGLKVWLVTKSRRGNREGSQQAFNGIGNWSRNGTTPADPNSYAIFERILPVVHHGF